MDWLLRQTLKVKLAVLAAFILLGLVFIYSALPAPSDPFAGVIR